MKFVSARDALYQGTLLGGVALLAGLALIVFLFPSSGGEKIIMSVAFAVLVPFILWIYLGTYYVITEELLIVHYGPFTQKINRDQIISIKEFHSIYTAPALSCDRLQIRYDKFGEIQVSPLDKKGFLEAMGYGGV